MLRNDPNHAGALHLLGLLSYQEADYQAAIQLISRAIALSGPIAAFYNNYGLAIHALGRFAEALASFRRALEICPQYPQALANLGMAQQSLGECDAALASYREALKLDPHHPDASIKLAVLLEQLGRADEAIRLYEDGIRHAPCLEFYVNLGSLWISAKRADLAVVPLEKAIELAPRCIVAHLNLGMARSATGNYAAALVSFRKALELAPDNAETQKRFGAFLDKLGRSSAVSAEGADDSKAGTVGNNAGQESMEARVAAFPLPNPLPEGEGDLCGAPPEACGPHPNPLPGGEGTTRIAFVSPHCLLDFTNGAATATLDGLRMLGALGFDCQVFCGSRLDAWDKVALEEVLARRGERYEVRDAQIGPFPGRMIFTSHGKLPVTVMKTAWASDGWLNREEIAAFLTGCELFLERTRPDVLWTYGGDPVSLVVQQMAKERGIPIVFWLHNFSYSDLAAFRFADRVVVPTEFARRHYREKLGLECEVLPLVVDPERVGVRSLGFSRNPGPPPKGGTMNSWAQSAAPHPNPLPEGEGTIAPHPGSLREEAGIKYVTFVNPEPRKGVHVFARIAEVLSARRPDIPLLLVEGVSTAGFLSKLGIDLGGIKNLTVMPNTPDARRFHAVTKLLLMPSLMENAGLVAIEAMLNGIPVLGSSRGGLPEAVGDAGFLFPIPARYTPKTRDLPTAEEVAPWVETIIRVWDDPAEYERRRSAALARSRRWTAESLAGTYAEFFGRMGRGKAKMPSPPAPLPEGEGSKIPSPPAPLPEGEGSKRPSPPAPLPEGEGSVRAPRHKAPFVRVPAAEAVGAGVVFASAGFQVVTTDHGQATRGTAPARPLVTCRALGRSGRLGNQLFQIAATIGTARRSGLDFVFPPWSYAEHFERAIPQSAAVPETETYDEPSFAYNEVRVCRSTDLAGCFQSERYFKHCEAEVRSYFSPCAELLAGLRERFGDLLARPTCSVHVRRGDYVQLPEYVQPGGHGLL